MSEDTEQFSMNECWGYYTPLVREREVFTLLA